MPVDDLKIWKQLAESTECREAVYYYGLCNGQQILQRGAADFDQKYCASDADEKAHYRTNYYVSEHGYMDMHLKQNLAAFRHCFTNDDIPQPLLLVDFGCGPMTSGLALAQILSEQSPDYKTHTAYFGIDASKNMVAKAQNINKEHTLFEKFKVVQGDCFDSQAIPHSFPKPQIVVFCFSFVLAPETFKPDIGNEQEQKTAAYRLAKDWKQYVETQQECTETRIIYLNPKPENPENPKDNYFDRNWKLFKAEQCKPDTASKFRYTDKYVPLPVAGLNTISLHTIHGKR